MLTFKKMTRYQEEKPGRNLMLFKSIYGDIQMLIKNNV